MMRKLTLFALLLTGLGCSGMTEKLVEMSTGGEMQITENGMIMRMEDGTTVEVVSQNAQAPEDFPLPPPSEDAKLLALTRNTDATGQESVMLSYELDQPKDAVLDRYRAWFAERGIEPTFVEENAMGTYNAVLQGSLSEDMQVGVVISQAFGSDALTLMAGPDLDTLKK